MKKIAAKMNAQSLCSDNHQADHSRPAPSSRDIQPVVDEVDNDALMHLWYVSTPFEVVCITEGADEEDPEDGVITERPRPLVAVDFGHAVWIEFVDNEDSRTREDLDNEDDSSRPPRDIEEKWLRFVTFPPFGEGLEKMGENDQRWSRAGGEVRTLEIPDDLDLDAVETINIDQSQGAVILSVKDGKIFILCYE